MPSVAEISLAVIAAAFLLVVVALVPALNQVRRTAARAEEVLAGVNESLPGLLIDLRTLVGKLSGTVETLSGVTESLQALSASMDHLGRFAEATARTVEGVRDTTRHVTRDVIMPSVANAAGLFAALWEGVRWMRPGHDRKEG